MRFAFFTQTDSSQTVLYQPSPLYFLTFLAIFAIDLILIATLIDIYRSTIYTRSIDG